MKKIDKVKKYWDTQPCNIKHSDLPMGTKEYFNAVEKRKYFVESHIPKFADFKKWKGKKVLEIGSGIGTDSVNFVRNGADLTIVELSEKSLEITKQRLKLFKLKAKAMQGNAEELTTLLPKGEKFDLIYSFGVIHHSPDPRKIIEETSKLLKPKGVLKIMLYAKVSTKNFLINLGISQPEAQNNCPIAFTYTKHEVKDLLSPFYKNISVEKDHIFLYSIPEYKKYIYKRKFIWACLPNFFIKILEKLLGWHLLISAELNNK
ncbi:MAG: class I SAM-dependent methyltransferase [Rickettsiales bacterium]|nr:class I SAM-dependent methyltransferase [Rickettsiales bacterium]